MKTILIGLDIDGVLVSDVHPEESWDNIDMSSLYWYRKSAVPFINLAKLPRSFASLPDVKLHYVLVTGRPAPDAENTKHWLQRFFQDLPHDLFHCDYDQMTVGGSAEHKSNVVNRLNISLFVESCPEQALSITLNCPTCHVVTMDDVIFNGLNSYLSKLESFLKTL
jgi:uncharacterized HAD superfamily protein